MLTEKIFEDILVKYPELIEDRLTLIGRQVTYFRKRIDILLEDRFREKLIIELKIGNLQRDALSQVLEYEGYILPESDPSARVMIIANRIPRNLKNAMDHHGIEYKEITIKHLREFLEKRDDQLLNAISGYDPTKAVNPEPGKSEDRRIKTVEEHLKDSSTEIIALFGEINRRILELSTDIIRYTTWQNILYKTTVIFVELNVQRQRLRLLLRTRNGQIDDPKHLTHNVPKSHGWGNLTHNLYIDPKELNIRFSMDDIMKLLDQSFKATH